MVLFSSDSPVDHVVPRIIRVMGIVYNGISDSELTGALLFLLQLFRRRPFFGRGNGLSRFW